MFVWCLTSYIISPSHSRKLLCKVLPLETFTSNKIQQLSPSFYLRTDPLDCTFPTIQKAVFLCCSASFLNSLPCPIMSYGPGAHYFFCPTRICYKFLWNRCQLIDYFDLMSFEKEKLPDSVLFLSLLREPCTHTHSALGVLHFSFSDRDDRNPKAIQL